MNITNVSPSEVKLLWNEPQTHRHKLPHIGRETGAGNDHYNGLVTRGCSRFSISNQYSGIEGWGYGMWNSHSRLSVKNMYSLERDEEIRLQRLTKLREFGYDYLIPPGQYRSMRAILDDDDDAASDEIDLDNPSNNLADGHGIIGTAENLETFSDDAAATDGDFQAEDIGEQRIIMNDGLEADLPVPGPQQQDELGEEEQGEETEDVEVDLDAAIPEAEDNDYGYSDDYDEDEYQQGFMAEEEYVVRQVDEEQSSRQQPPVTNEEHSETQVQAIEPSLVTPSPANSDSVMDESDDGVDMSFA